MSAKPISFAAAAKQRGKPAPRKRKPKPKTPMQMDPNINTIGRVFELTSFDTYSDSYIPHKFRLRTLVKGGIEEQIWDVGNVEYYVGMVSEYAGGKKPWTPYGYGLLPTDRWLSIREINEVEEAPKPTDLKKKEDEK